MSVSHSTQSSSQSSTDSSTDSSCQSSPYSAAKPSLQSRFAAVNWSVLLWAIGVPIPIVLIVALMRGCH